MAEEKKMIIDGVSCPFTTERNVLEVARNNGIDIPSLCYCENLSIYGGCRLCLVENDRGKMDAACSMQPRDGMVVSTHTKQVLDSRRTTLQLLMSSHRADCLTCDQSGRCKLQEYARRYHVDAHRFEPNTYCTEPMDLSSPSIVRDPSKCILCGLCVRTCAEIQNIGAVDFSGRGKKAPHLRRLRQDPQGYRLCRLRPVCRRVPDRRDHDPQRDRKVLVDAAGSDPQGRRAVRAERARRHGRALRPARQ